MKSTEKENNDIKTPNIKVIYGVANFNKKVIVLIDASDNSEIIEDSSVSQKIYFDKIIDHINKEYISYITISGIRRYSLIRDNEDIKAEIQYLSRNQYKWDIFKIYKNHYIDNYIKPKDDTNNKPSLSKFIKTLKINMQPKPLGLCAQFVHWALNAAGLKFQGKYSAKLYHEEGLLKELGFHEIAYDSNLLKGDIAVVVDKNLVKYNNYYGHICAWDGECWLCDDKELIINGNKDTIHYYRYDLWEE